MVGAYKGNHKSNDNFLKSLNYKRNRLVLFYGLMANGNPKTFQFHKFFFHLKNTCFPYLYQKCTQSQKKKFSEALKEKRQLIPGEPTEKVKWEFFRADTDDLPLGKTGQLANRQELPCTDFLPARRIIKRIGNHSFKPKIVRLKEYIVGLSLLMVNHQPKCTFLLS